MVPNLVVVLCGELPHGPSSDTSPLVHSACALLACRGASAFLSWSFAFVAACLSHYAPPLKRVLHIQELALKMDAGSAETSSLLSF